MATAQATATRKTQNWLLRTVKESQQAVVDTVSIWSKVIENAVPATRKLSRSDQAGSPKIVGQTFDLAEKVIEAQRQFATTVADAVTSPVVRRPARKSTPAA